MTFTITMLLMTALVSGCSQEDFATQPTGMLHLGIGHSAKATETRANPHQMGKPMADKFNLRIQRKDNVFYEGKFVESLELKVGSYDIIAYYGEDVVIGKDTPYYEGVATALIEEDMATSVTIPCRVANSLISVVFGRDEIERARFDKYYVDHTLALYPVAASGAPWSATYFQSKGDPITDLHEDLAAEQKARTTYDNILRLVKDPEVCDPIRFLREREIVHYQRFGESLRIVQDKLDSKNFYAINPEFDLQRKCNCK